MDNIFDFLKQDVQNQELVNELFIANSIRSLRIERIVSKGQISEPDFYYDQHEDEWILLVQGNAKLTFEKPFSFKNVHSRNCVELNTGDFLLIPKHCKHRIDFTSSEPECIWLAIFIQ